MTDRIPAGIIAVVGPTATGKSELAVKIARSLGGSDKAVVVGADAMALYQGMDIGTAKVSEEIREEIPHLQVGLLPVSAEASVAKYQEQATAQVEATLADGKTPVVVGGSGLYVRALLDQLHFPPTDARVRARFENQAEQEGPRALYETLQQQDPKAAESIAPTNQRRLVRALEVIEITGRPFSATLPAYEYHWPTVQVGLTGPLEVLDERIRLRAERMFRQGLVDEVRRLLPLGLEQSRTAQYATGYQQALGVLGGTLSELEAIEDTVRATSRLARKQLKWFKRDPRINWIDITEPSVWVRTQTLLRSAGHSV